MMHTAIKKVLIYSQDGLGLGHLRRNLNICRQLKKYRPQVSCLIIADSPVAPFFKMPAHCDFVKIPTIVKVDSGVWRSNRLPVKYTELVAMRAEIIRNIMLSFRPHVFVVDHMPHGALGELAQPLAMLKKHCPHTKVVLGLRDILGAPDVICRQWQKEGAFAAAEAFYDAINIYGCAELFDALAEYNFPPALLHKTRYCGYVCRENTEAAASAKRTNGNGHDRFILVTGGGGADAAFFMDQFVAAAHQLRHDLRFQALITTGPFMPEDQRLQLRRKVQDLPLTISQQHSLLAAGRSRDFDGRLQHHQRDHALSQECDCCSPARPQRRANHAHAPDVRPRPVQHDSSARLDRGKSGRADPAKTRQRQ